MNDMVIVPEVIEADDKLVRAGLDAGLEIAVSQSLAAVFAPVFSRARTVLASARGVAESVKDATCVTEIRKSRECRLAIRAVRIDGEKIHRAQKESSLRYSRAVDGFKNILLADLAPVEEALDAAEKTAERAEAARKAALKAQRDAELQPLLDYQVQVNLGDLDETVYQSMISDARAARQAKLDTAAKAEAERLAKAAADKAERDRIAAEIERLKAEAEAAAAEAKRVAKELEKERARVAAEREAERRKAAAEAQQAAEVARKEREALEAKARAEREAVEEQARKDREEIERKAREEKAKSDAESAKLRAELEAKQKAEDAHRAKVEAEEKARKIAERKAASAPDKAKLMQFAEELNSLGVPMFASKELTAFCVGALERCIAVVKEKAESL